MSFKLIKRSVAMFFAILFLLSPLQAYAHNTYFIQVLIDQNTYRYQNNILNDDETKEADHYENSFGNFQHYVDNETLQAKNDPDYKYYKEGSLEQEIAVFSFNPVELNDGWFDGAVNHSNKDDADRAYLIGEELTSGLNEALFILNGNKKFDNINQMVKMTSDLTALGTGSKQKKSGKINGWTVTFGERAYSNPLSDYQKNTLGVTTKDFVKIQKGSEKYEFIFRMPKGYIEKGSWDNRVYDGNLKSQYEKFVKDNGLVISDTTVTKDVKNITWHMLAGQAHYALYTKDWTMNNASEIAKLSPVEEFFVGMLHNLLVGLRNILGLYDINELVYNDGVRGSKAWVQGAMPEMWHDNVVKFHMIFQGIAWALISLAVVKALIQRNLSTINPAMRVSLIEQIQNLLITGVILSFIFPIISMFLSLNMRIVDLFGALAPDFSDFAQMGTYSNWLAGLLVECFYFVVTIYLNFTYIMRSITLALLIAMAPIFIVAIAFGGKYKPLFGVWLKELVANIFLQAFHAFILVFFVTSMTFARGIEQAVIAFAMIPLTEFFRSLIMGQAGGTASKLGMSATMGAIGAVSSMAGKAKNMVGTTMSKGGSKDGQSYGDDMMEMKQNGKSESMGSAQQQPVKSIKPGQGSAVETQRALNNREVPHGIYTKGQVQTDSQGNITHEPSAEDMKNLDMFTGGKSMSGKQAGIKDAMSAMKPDSLSGAVMGGMKGAVNVGLGGAVAATGIGMAMAFGGENAFALHQGMNMTKDGVARMNKGVSPIGNRMQAVGSAYKAGVQLDKQPKFKSDVSDSGMTTTSEGMEMTSKGTLVHRDGQKVQQESGITNARMEGNNAVYTYDQNRLSSHDQANIDYYNRVFNEGGSQEEQDYVRSQGIEGVNRTVNGGYAVTYNQEGLKQMGVSQVRTVGDGENKRIVETKTGNQPLHSYNTVNVQRAMVGSSDKPVTVRPPHSEQPLRPTQAPVQFNQTTSTPKPQQRQQQQNQHQQQQQQRTQQPRP